MNIKSIPAVDGRAKELAKRLRGRSVAFNIFLAAASANRTPARRRRHR
jgi:hypothetical protein